MKFVDPVRRIGGHELPHRRRIVVEVDRLAPFGPVAAREIRRRELTEEIAVRPEVVVDDVEDDGDPMPVRRVDEPSQVVRNCRTGGWGQTDRRRRSPTRGGPRTPRPASSRIVVMPRSASAGSCSIALSQVPSSVNVPTCISYRTCRSIDTPVHDASFHEKALASTIWDGPCGPKGWNREAGSGKRSAPSPSRKRYNMPAVARFTSEEKYPPGSGSRATSASEAPRSSSSETATCPWCGAHTLKWVPCVPRASAPTGSRLTSLGIQLWHHARAPLRITTHIVKHKSYRLSLNRQGNASAVCILVSRSGASVPQTRSSAWQTASPANRIIRAARARNGLSRAVAGDALRILTRVTPNVLSSARSGMLQNAGCRKCERVMPLPSTTHILKHKSYRRSRTLRPPSTSWGPPSGGPIRLASAVFVSV